MTQQELTDRIVAEVIAGGMTAAKAARVFPARGEAGCNPITIWRWMSQGLLAADGRRVRLESAKIGGTMYTSRQAIERFVAALQGDDPSGDAAKAPKRAVATARKREIAAAEAELATQGV